MQEVEGPSPEDVGETHEKESGLVSKEEIAEKFYHFANNFVHNENKPGADTKVLSVEKDKLFSIVDHRASKYSRPVTRQYWGYNPGETRGDFSRTAEAQVWDSGLITLEKRGRPDPRMDTWAHNDESETLSLSKPEGAALRYEFDNIIGEDRHRSSVVVSYDHEGRIKLFSSSH